MTNTSQNIIGSVMVVGGGIAGVQAALDLADTGYFVYLIENTAAIGGTMSALDKTFPTNDCSMCILSPKLVECGRHPNIEIITLTDVEGIEGRAGNFQVSLHQKARYIDMEKCIACGACAEKCPRKVNDEFNQGLNQRKAAYVKFPQAVPLKYAIDKDNCIYFEKGKCRACEKLCPAGAINFEDTDRDFTLNVGGIILSPGFQPFDPTLYDTYGYSRFPNVVTAMEFERILAPSGPNQGHLVRPSDKKDPRRIAWLQCIGSRDMNRCDNGYCSAVCCTYAIKEAVISKEHAGSDLDCSIFYMDMRTHGKEFEKYYDTAREKHGVRFIRARVHTVESVAGTGDLRVKYVNEQGEIIEETFGMLVLSVGLEISPDSIKLADKLGINLTDGRFCKTGAFRPVSTSKEGIYVCGAFAGPKDIPQSVMEASSAAAEASALLSSSRNTQTREKEILEERDISSEDPRIGVFVCHCGINIGSVVDVPAVKTYAEGLPHVVYAQENLFTCSQDTQDQMKETIREHKLNRIVVASCSPRTHEPLFQQTIQETGLNKYLFELANIRDQNSWVHQKTPEAATEKAKDLVRMAVAKVALQEPLKEQALGVTKSGLVIGGGVAGMEAARSLAGQGYPVTLVEAGPTLGGNAKFLNSSWSGASVTDYLKGVIRDVSENPLISVHVNAVVEEVKGFVGNFSTIVDVNGEHKQISHGAAIIATGGNAYQPNEYQYGDSDRIYLSLDLDRAIKKKDEAVLNAQSAVFIQCVGSREAERPYCSRVCCTHSIESALALKELNPSMRVSILYRDIRTYGLRERLYQEARKKGVLFFRFDVDQKPKVAVDGDGLEIEVFDHVLKRTILLEADILTLASAIVPVNTESLAKHFKVPRNQEGFFLEAHMKLRPVDFATDGVFVAGLSHYPKPIEECIAQAKAAAARAATVLAKDSIMAGGVAAVIDRERCCGCHICVECCPFGAISYIEAESRSEVNQALCKGCGTCAAACTSEAISLMGFSHTQLYTQIEQALATKY
ncbi:4Fe-4S ferredoxin, iron-sulfur binding domain protein [uncultured Desulfobacterium sp.]|uniref:4Fe-4S ferredoxin, iron-sulfur binding domain protein n=1 Tax=uncultured Desulfobacterium sp. TaxID=201089 RepID=A0A445N0S6_9BACT|nr:4Fe-4S ferredoxin, iron-sulfur binding domain protein [uncultured Desulfobacterium sp.]